jgi:hypothetical protein
VLFDCRDKVPRVKAIDCPREVRSGICNDRIGLVSGASDELNVPNWTGQWERDVNPKLPNVTI